MDAKQEKREEVLKILQMIEDGKIDQDKALGMIAVLEGKDVIGGPGGVVKGRQPRLLRVLGGMAGFALLVGLLYVLFVYLPVNAPLWSVIVVYSFLGLTVLAGAAVAIIAVTKTMAVGRAAVEQGRRDKQP